MPASVPSVASDQTRPAIPATRHAITPKPTIATVRQSERRTLVSVRPMRSTVQSRAADAEDHRHLGEFDADVEADEDADDAAVVPILEAIGDRRGEAEAVDEAEDRRDDEHLTIRRGAAVGHQRTETDRERDEGFDPRARVADPAERDGAERDGVAEREDQRASKGLAERRRPEEHRQHEQTMIPAVGHDVAEAIGEERDDGLIVGRSRAVADLEFTRFVLRHRHHRLEFHALAEIREHGAQDVREAEHEFLRIRRHGRRELHVHQHRVAIGFALATGLCENLIGRREGLERPGHGLAVGFEAQAREEELAARFDGSGQATRREHQRIEVLDRRVLG